MPSNCARRATGDWASSRTIPRPLIEMGRHRPDRNDKECTKRNVRGVLSQQTRINEGVVQKRSSGSLGEEKGGGGGME